MVRKSKRRMALNQIDTRKQRTRSFLFLCLMILPVFLYLFYALSGFFIIEPDVHSLRKQLVWCLMHPISIYNQKSMTMIFLGFILWGLFTYSYYVKLDKNLMHGQEYGAAKWGDIRAFNRKYGDGEDESANKILSENIRFKYDSSTLRNNNIFVVGGSGDCGIIVTGRTNPVKSRVCEA